MKHTGNSVSGGENRAADRPDDDGKDSRFEHGPEEIRRSLESERRQKAVLQELKEAQRRLGWNQLRLARAARISQPHLSSILNDGRVPRLDTFLDVVHAMDLEILLVSKALVPALEELAGNPGVQAYRGGGDRPRYAVEDPAAAADGAGGRSGVPAGADRPRYAAEDAEED